MTRRSRFLLRWAAGVVLAALAIVAVGVGTVSSQWFYNKLRERIVSVATEATGGRVEIQRFAFDWHTLTGTVTGFTLRGTEPGSGPPLFHADTIVVGLKIISILKRDVDIALLRMEKPAAFLLVAPDGTTNIPRPKTPSAPNKTPAQTILDLAIQHFELNNGTAEVHGVGNAPATQAYNAQGRNLRAVLAYDGGTLGGAPPRYHGDIAIAPLQVSFGSSRMVALDLTTTIAMEKNRLVVEKSRITTGESELKVNGKLEDFNAPVITAEYGAKFALNDAGRFINLKSRQSGWLEATGSASYKTSQDYAIQAVAKAYDVDYRGNGVTLRNIRAQARIDGGPASISIRDLVADALGGRITGKADVRDFDRFHVDGEIRHVDVREAASLAATEALPYDGSASGRVVMEGRFSELKRHRFQATARLNITPAGKGIPVTGLIDAKYNGTREQLDLGQSFIALPNTRADFQGTLGQRLQVHFSSSDLDDLAPVMRSTAQPVTIKPQGQIIFDGVVTGALSNPVLNGNLSGSNFVLQGQTIDSVSGLVTASPESISVTGGTLKQNALNATFSGAASLRNWKPADDLGVTASVGLRNADLGGLLAMAGRKDLPVSGTLNATAKVSGTFGDPQVAADLTLTHGAAMNEPVERLTAHIESPSRTKQTLTAKASAGSNQVNVSAAYDHGAASLFPGKLTVQLDSNSLALTKISTLHAREPDLSGSVKVAVQGEAGIDKDHAGNMTFALSRLKAGADFLSLQEAAKQLGDLHLTANTTSASGAGPSVDVQLRSNLADATITGDGRVTLAGDYPTAAKLQFSNVHLDTVRRLLLTPEQAQIVRVAGTVEGSVNISGPAAKPSQLQGSLDIPKLEIVPLPDTSGEAPPVDLTIRNSAPIKASLADGIVTVESARIVARDSDFSISGRATTGIRPDLDLHLNGNINLALIHAFDSDLVSSGELVANASVRGNVTAPQFAGSLEVKDANLAVADVPNGLSHANGRIEFNGNQASIRDLTAESGGGKVKVDGFGSMAGGVLSFRVGAHANGVRVRYPQGVSTVADAQLTLVGTQQRSTLSGNITIDRLAFNPKTDLGAILSSASAPPETPSGSTGFASNLQFDVQIQTAPDITFESSYTQSVEADANLRLRGTLASPALLGRVNITQGQLTFFGNKYTINEGSVSFFNPVKVQPVLNIDLETIARGVDVTLTVSGPITKLNVSYRSDPPLQFSEIVALLATGKTPDDATIAARQPTQNQQSWQQMGASALVGQTIANPVAGRLQRFFGVSNLKIDPSISGTTGSPQAKVTLEQQVTPEITFTYITDVANAQEQVIRVEWAFSQHWSAVAMRDENGEFGIDFLYKKRFR